MMGRQTSMQPRLFYTAFNLEQRVRKDHPLRRIKQLIDFDFIYKEVAARYGNNGNVSVPPPVLLKLLLLLVLYNVRSERELVATVAERLDWLWFLGYDIEDEIPNHSVLSKARQKWGREAFQRFFERVVWQCVEAGLVDGKKIFCDASLVDANASNNSVIDREGMRRHISQSYAELEDRLEEVQAAEAGAAVGGDADSGMGAVNRRHVSTTDPDATVVRQGKGKPKLRYKTHRAIDSAYGVVTATEKSSGSVNEAHAWDPW